MTTATSVTAAHARIIRAAADLIEQAGIPGLAIYPEPGRIVIQVPESGPVPSRAASVARLAAITGCKPGTDARPGITQGWLTADGTFAGHPVHVFAPVTKEDTP
jgi:hypothetical protein